MAKRIIVLDPGHGGRDPGAVGNNLLEKEINLIVAKQVAAFLSPYNAHIRLTRSDDSFMSLSSRAAFANNLGADYFISIHVNAGGGTGFESFIYNGTKNPSTVTLRSFIHREVAKYVREYGVIDRGEKTANFLVLRDTTMPALLLENLFIDNPRDAALLKDAAFIRGLSHAIADGIITSNNLQVSPSQPIPIQNPIAEPAWDPQREIQKLKEAGYIANDHKADVPVTWGQFATVLNRLIEKNKL